MKILIIDTLTETYNGTMVRSGLQKSAVLDAQAFSLRYDTTFMYCGNREDTYNYKHHIVAELGSKDYLISQGLDPKYQSSEIVKEYVLDNIEFMNQFDNIICHIHSFSSFRIADKLKGKNILFIIHDVLDYFYYGGLNRNYHKINKTDNNVKIITNSQYSIDRAWPYYHRRKEDMSKPDEVFYDYIRHFVWTDIKPMVQEKEDYSSIIGRFEPKKFHHKLYKFNHDTHKIHHYGIKDIRRDKDFKYFNKLLKSGNEVFVGLDDEQLSMSVSKGMNILIPCWHEGFGFTAFEAGIFGCVPIVMENRSPSQNIGHATAQYLKRANVFHYVVSSQSDSKLFDVIEESRNVTHEQRVEISNNLLKYFSVDNYINERIDLLNKSNKE